MIPLAQFFPKTVLVIQGLLCFHTNFIITGFSSVKNAIGIVIGMHWLYRLPWVVRPFNDVNSVSPDRDFFLILKKF